MTSRADLILGRVAGLAVAEARAAAQKVSAMLEFADARQDEAELLESTARRHYAIQAIADELAVELGAPALGPEHVVPGAARALTHAGHVARVPSR